MDRDLQFEERDDGFRSHPRNEDDDLGTVSTDYEDNEILAPNPYSPKDEEMTAATWETSDSEEKSEFAVRKEKLLEDFKNWLDDIEEESIQSYPNVDDEPSNYPDLNSFYRELASLKQEVRLQSKANQSIGQSVQKLSTSLEENLEDSIRDVSNAVHDVKQQIPEARRDAQRVFALELVDIVEGLERSATALLEVRLPSLLIGDAKKRGLSKTLCKPNELLLSKALDSLRRLKIKPAASIGDRFDPSCMRAVGYTDSKVTAPGNVSEICLQGYKLDEVLIRTSEVKVEK